MAVVNYDVRLELWARDILQENIVFSALSGVQYADFRIRTNVSVYSRNNISLTFDCSQLPDQPGQLNVFNSQNLNLINYANIKGISGSGEYGTYENTPIDGYWYVNDFSVNGRLVTLVLTKDRLNTYWNSISDNDEVIVATSDSKIIDKKLPNGNYIALPEKEYKYIEIDTPFGKSAVDVEHNSNMVIEVVGI